MKYCYFCGAGLQDNMLFCPSCGKRFFDAEARVEEQSAENKTVTMNIDYKNETPTIEMAKQTKQKSKKRSLGWLIACILIIVAISSVIIIQNGQNEIDEICNSVLYLELYDDSDLRIGSASGFIIKDGTTLVTNYHVIEGSYYIVAKTADGQKSTVADKVLAYDKSLDLAILKCDQNLGISPIPLGDSDAIQQGDKVYAIGYPLGLANTLSDGVISSLYEDNGVKTIQTTAAISSGSSGGVLLNKKGEAIGVTAASYEDGQNLNLAIPINYVKEIIDKSDATLFGLPQLINSAQCSIDDLQGTWIATAWCYQIEMTISATRVSVKCTTIDDNLNEGDLYYVPEDNCGTLVEKNGMFIIWWDNIVGQNDRSVVIEYTGDSLRLNCVYTNTFNRQ